MSRSDPKSKSTQSAESLSRPASLSSTDLIVDSVYQGGRQGHAGDDPLVPMLGVSNQGGFRHLGKRVRPKMVVLTTTMNEPDWPDRLDLETGVFTYYGDNRKPGQELHQTRRWGNEMLRDIFERGHGDQSRIEVPPILVFRNTGTYRDVVFVGLAVPGGMGLRPSESLVATWHQIEGRRFQNYRALFTILDVASISRDWILDVHNGELHSSNAPQAWMNWVVHGRYDPLKAHSNQPYRSRAQQLPSKPEEVKLINTLLGYFQKEPIAFERCAARITQMLLPNVTSIDVTRPSRDGGRDAVGTYRIGSFGSRVEVEFAMEAKCYAMGNAVGVKQTSRLISRLRHRQFGILITTSFVNTQAYKEIIDDGHPVLVVSAVDIVEVLRANGICDSTELLAWLEAGDGLSRVKT
ncbi:restriction endonuclease [Stenotrophomonas bentonitica]